MIVISGFVDFIQSEAVGVIGLIVTVVTLVRVGLVAKAQKSERELMQKMFGIDELVLCLRTTSSYLNKQSDQFAKEIAYSLNSHIGKLDGIQKALELQGKITNPNKANLIFQGEGHFSVDYIKAKVGSVQDHFDIIVMRNLVCSQHEILSEIRKACGRGVKVRFLSLSPKADDKVIKSLLKSLPNPKPKNVDSLRQQLETSQSAVLDSVQNEWDSYEASNFEYKVYDELPSVHAVRADHSIFIGFPVTRASTQEDEYVNRPYIELPLSVPLGKQFGDHFEEVWKDSDNLGGVREA